MKSRIKKNLWWIVTAIVLFFPIAFIICNLSVGFSDKLFVGGIPFVVLFFILSVIGVVANKIKRMVLKILWIILGFLLYVIVWIFTLFVIVLSAPDMEENMENRKEGIRDMIYSEFDNEDHLDNVVGIQLPQYNIVDSECVFASSFPTETEYDVKLKIHFPQGLPQSVWSEVSELASNNASNPLSECNVINKWGFDKYDHEIIYYQSEDSINIGCVVAFRYQCDTVHVTCYKW